MMTNLNAQPVGTTVVTTNADGSVEFTTLVSKTEHSYLDLSLWFTVMLGIGVLLLAAIKVAKRFSKPQLS